MGFREAALDVCFAVFLLLSCSIAAQTTMPHADYETLLRKIDGDIPRWQMQVSRFHVEDFSVSFVDGKFTQELRDDAARGFESLRELIASDLAQRRLSTEIQISQHLNLAAEHMQDLSLFAFKHASSKIADEWSNDAAASDGALRVYELSLTEQLSAYADELQRKAEKCSR